MTEFYSNGTASVTNGDATVTSVGAAVWIAANVKKGDLFLAGNTVNVLVTDPVYDAGTSSYSFELGLAYTGTTNASVPYIIVKTSAEWGTNRTLSLQTAELIQGYAVGAISETQLNTAVAAAEAAQAAAELALDQFTDIWLGVKSADPTSDNDGNALADGSFYLNSVSGLVRIRAAGAWTNFNAGVQGIQGVGAGLQYVSTTSTTDADPGGPGNLRFNNTDHAAATKLWLDDTDINGVSMAATIMAWGNSTSSVKGHLFIWNRANRAIFRLYNVTSAPTDKTGYREVSIAHVSSSGALSNNTPSEVIFIAKGDKGDTGATGQADGTPMVFSTAITDADPGNGKVRADSATFGSIARLFFDNQDANGVSLTDWLDSFDNVANANARGYLRGRKSTDATVWMEFAVLGAVVDGGGYRKVSVLPVSGAIPADLTSMVWTFSPAGTDGSAGTDGTDPGVVFNFDTSTTDSNPTAGGLRADSSSLTAANNLYVSKTNRAGNSIATFLATFDDSTNPTIKGILTLTKAATGVQVVYQVTGITDATGYVKVAVQSGSGVSSFGSGDRLSLQFSRTGDRGTSGAGSGDVNKPSSAVAVHEIMAAANTAGDLLEGTGKAIADLLLASNNLSDVGNKTTALDTLFQAGATVTAAATTNLETLAGPVGTISGNTGISAITLNEGHMRLVRFSGTPTLTVGSSLVLNTNGSNYTAVAGDAGLFFGRSGGVVQGIILPVSGSSPGTQPLDADLTAIAALTTTTFGRSLLTKTAAEDARTSLVTPTYVSTRTALKALDTTKDTVAVLTEAGREGTFIWMSGNYSARVTADTLEGIYVKATAIASSVGAWVRIYAEAVRPEWYGAAGDGVANDAAAIQAAVNSGARKIVFGPKNYRITTTINVTNLTNGGVAFAGAGRGYANGSTIVGETSGLMFDCTGSQEIEFIDMQLESGSANKSTIGILFARSHTSQYAQFNSLTRCLIQIESNTAANGGAGTIAVYNYSAELFVLTDTFLVSDAPYIVTATNVLGLTSAFTTIETGLWSTSLISSNAGSFRSTAFQAVWIEGAVSDITFDNFYALRASGTYKYAIRFGGGLADGIRFNGNVEGFERVAYGTHTMTSMKFEIHIAGINAEPLIYLDGAPGFVPGLRASYVNINAWNVTTQNVIDQSATGQNGVSGCEIYLHGSQSLNIAGGYSTANEIIATSNSAPTVLVSGAGFYNYILRYRGGQKIGGPLVIEDTTSLGFVKSSSASGGIGYATGAGGTVTQATNKATGVTLNKITGQITMNAGALSTRVSFTVTNSTVAVTDGVVVWVASGGTSNAYRASVGGVASGSFNVTLENISGGSLSEAPVIGFAVIKAVNA